MGTIGLFMAAFALAAPPASVHQFVAFKAGRVAPGLDVKASVRGDCWTTSMVEGRANTWRCMHGRYIHDPCFTATPRSRVAVCPGVPWSRRVLVLRLTKSLPAQVEHWDRRRFPWGVKTTTGARCVSVAGGAADTVAGRRVTYICGRHGGLLLGFVRRSTPTWTIHHAQGWHSKRVTVVGISDAWW